MFQNIKYGRGCDGEDIDLLKDVESFRGITDRNIFFLR